MNLLEKLKQAYIKDDNGEVNLLTVMITVLMLMFCYLFVKAEVLNKAISETIAGSVVQLISIAFGGVGILGGIRKGVDIVNQNRQKANKPKIKPVEDAKDIKGGKIEQDVVAVVGDQLSENFHISEFMCHDGTPVPEVYRPNVLKLAHNLQTLRNHLNKRITVTSGYRTPAHNRSVGGKPASKHMLAMAADIQVEDMTPKQVHTAIEKLIKEGKMQEGGLGSYPTFTHYDVRGVKARW